MRFEQPRSIKTIEDVVRIVESGTYSFEEMLDSVLVARTYDNWPLVERCTLAAMAKVNARPLSRDRLASLAHQISVAILKRSSDLDDVGRDAKAAKSLLEGAASVAPSVLTESLEREMWLLDEVGLMVEDQQVPSLVGLCARLRKLERPDLGRIAASRALTEEPDNAAALTTRATAAMDEDDWNSAESDLNQAWHLLPSAYVAMAFARLSAAIGEPEQIGYWLAEAETLRDSMRLGTQDPLFREGLSEKWPLYLAGSLLVRAGEFSEAASIARELSLANAYLSDLLREEIRQGRSNRTKQVVGNAP